MAAGRARRAAREAMRREFMMAGGPIDMYSRLRRTGTPSAVDGREKAFQRSGTSLPLGDHVRHPLSHHSAAQHRQLSVGIYTRLPSWFTKETIVTE